MKDSDVTVSLKCDPAQVAAWERAAQRAGMSRQAWCKAVCDVAAGNAALLEQLARAQKAGRAVAPRRKP